MRAEQYQINIYKHVDEDKGSYSTLLNTIYISNERLPLNDVIRTLLNLDAAAKENHEKN